MSDRILQPKNKCFAILSGRLVCRSEFRLELEGRANSRRCLYAYEIDVKVGQIMHRGVCIPHTFLVLVNVHGMWGLVRHADRSGDRNI